MASKIKRKRGITISIPLYSFTFRIHVYLRILYIYYINIMHINILYYISLIVLFIVDMNQAGRNQNRSEFKTATLTLYKDYSDNADIQKDFISVINQLDAQNFCFTLSLFHASTCFEHMCSS